MNFNSKGWVSINIKDFPSELSKKNKGNNSIIEPINSSDLPEIEVKNDKLKGLPFALKDNMAMNGVVTSAASKIIKNFKPNFNSTALIKLMQAGAIPVAKANLDELAMGGSGLVSNYGKVYHPFIKNGIIGGSSSGSAYLVANGDLPFAIGTDTGDSVRKPAAYAGIVGFKPTWGLVSRYGIYDFSPTWDTLSWFTNTVNEAAVLLDVLAGYDSRDATSIEVAPQNYEENLKTDKKFKIGLIKSEVDGIPSEEIKSNYYSILKKAKADGHEIIELDANMEILGRLLIVYRIISSVEAFSVNSNLTGFLFGEANHTGKTFEEQITNARTEGFAFEVKKRFLYAMESISNNEKIYHDAAKARTLIINELDRLFGLVDTIVLPAHLHFKPEEDIKHHNYDTFMNDFLGLFNANGSPSITIPTNHDKTAPTALNVAAKPFDDIVALQVAKILEGYNE